MIIEESCLLCPSPAWHIPFCANHTHGWVISSERQAIDFTSGESYNAGVAAYVARITADRGSGDLHLQTNPPEFPSFEERR